MMIPADSIITEIDSQTNQIA
jgi:hypothetical protein